MRELLSLAKKKAQEAEVFLTTHEETPATFEANRLKQLQTTQRTTVGLRLVKEGRIGFASSTSLEDREMLIDKAVAVNKKFKNVTPIALSSIYNIEKWYVSDTDGN